MHAISTRLGAEQFGSILVGHVTESVLSDHRVLGPRTARGFAFTKNSGRRFLRVLRIGYGKF